MVCFRCQGSGQFYQIQYEDYGDYITCYTCNGFGHLPEDILEPSPIYRSYASLKARPLSIDNINEYARKALEKLGRR